MTNIFQECCLAKRDYYIKRFILLRLYIHETIRVYSDHLVSEDEIKVFETTFEDIMKKTNLSTTAEELFAPQLLYTNFVTITDGSYLPIPIMEKFKSVLDSKLFEYNENILMMDLVLFEMAILHLTRIN